MHEIGITQNMFALVLKEAGKAGAKKVSKIDLVKWFSIDLFRRRLGLDYILRSQEYGAGFLKKLQEIGKRGPYWFP